jgi:hypothetical protein
MLICLFAAAETSHSVVGWRSKECDVCRVKIAAILATGFFDHILRTDESYAQKWNYVRDNPVRAGLVRTADHCRTREKCWWSTERSCSGMRAACVSTWVAADTAASTESCFRRLQFIRGNSRLPRRSFAEAGYWRVKNNR